MKLSKSLPAISVFILICLTHPAHAITLKIATIAPAGSSWMDRITKAAAQIKAETDGRVKFKFYPGGVMGTQETVLKKMRIGQLHGGTFTSGTLGALYPDSQIYSLPLIFRDLNEVDYVRKKMDKQIAQGLENAGIVTLGISEGGMAYAMSDEPIIRISDLLQHKIWSPEHNKNVALTLQAFDVSAIPLSIGDVLIGLQTDLIDTVATSPTAAIILQWHTQIKYITDVPLIYFYSVLAIDKKAFNRMAEDDQLIVRRIMSDTIKEVDKKSREDNFAAFNALQQNGITLVKPDNDEIVDWYRKGKEATQLIFSEGGMSNKAIDELMTHINNFRIQQASINAAEDNEIKHP